MKRTMPTLLMESLVYMLSMQHMVRVLLIRLVTMTMTKMRMHCWLP